ncbi:MAG: hypothetical protein ACI8QZ_002849 [Chlamydiales bacterium]|jgi:hypothetical protein
MGTSEGSRHRPAPLWVWLLLGWLAGRTWLEGGARRAGDVEARRVTATGGLETAGIREVCMVEMDPLPLGIPGVRAFRSVPGVGRTRSLMLIRHLWESGAGADFGRVGVAWEEIEGIGPVTAGELERAFGVQSGCPRGVGCRATPGDGVHSGRKSGHDDDSVGTCGSGKRAVCPWP